MKEIKLKNGQTGYDVIGEYIRRYWKHNIFDTAIISMSLSYNGQTYDSCKAVACPYDGDIEYLHDWWEGEKYIRLFGITTIGELDISGGLYED